MMNINFLYCSCFIFLLFLAAAMDAKADTFTVTHTADPVPQNCTTNSCSLREAIIASNASNGPDVIVLPDEAYELTLTGADNDSMVGDLDVLGVVTITSDTPSSANQFEIIGDMGDRIFDLHPGAALTLNHAILSDGQTNSDGGGIKANGAILRIENSDIVSNQANSGGGILLYQSDAVIRSSTISANQADDDGGGLLIVDSTVLLDQVILSLNHASFGGGLATAYLYSLNGQPNVHIINSSVVGNRANEGGGLWAWSQLGQTAGWILVQNTNFWSNQAQSRGGGIFHFDTRLDIEGSMVYFNLAEADQPTGDSHGGGIYTGIPFQSGDHADLSVTDSAVFYNRADGSGGGLYVADRASINNTTISSNEANVFAAINATEGNLRLLHVTAAANLSANEVDIYIGPGTAGTVQNSIISGRCQTVSFVGFGSLGGNIESPGDSCGLGSAPNDQVNVFSRALIEEELADNGGQSWTHAIRYRYSPAVGNAIPIAGITHDQRLYSRDAEPDSGALEAQENEFHLIFEDGFE
ncbi:CSLREA domain-containing protein [Marinicella meishanensis]|uniref:CSLREA domain-containing protein n=1 Tax=Marinicella meishanensis TaxID=2873263 RepID=UPI001CBF50C1|nr:CSLREA domain-containing protein [Marinicella sp. NBU2979]